MYQFKKAMPADEIDALYDACDLQGKLDRDVFRKAMSGFSRIQPPKDQIISIIDFSLPSTEKRFYVIDLENKELRFYTYTSHGVNTGEDRAIAFSNLEGSRQSSLGFYLTAETYEGKHGRSLKLDGLERDFNGLARRRYIVVHSADYVTEDFIEEHGRLGRSWGCARTPRTLRRISFEVIREGSVLFIYADDEKYLKRSKLIR
ncbi:MAG: murein L,D-transpeptidase catalytic domain family protein [Candidatus Marinimicrobia bacterium]|nr:murein L,D-transpeptidase catalytic domain family protein [Candidatus Neomarinimicrobiota bacterium]